MNHTTPVQGTYHPELSAGNWMSLETPGDWTFDERELNVLYCCPCGCGQVTVLPIHITLKTQRPSWEWNGITESLTLSPSIRRLDGCKWHGHVVGGVWTPVADSGA